MRRERLGVGVTVSNTDVANVAAISVVRSTERRVVG